MSCLTCPTDPNLGDVALQLQKTALEAEACIYTQEQLLRSAVNRPTVITSIQTPQNLLVNVQYDFNDFTDTLVFANTALTNWSDFFNLGGIIMCGMFFNVTATGAATDNTSRRAFLRTKRNNMAPITNETLLTIFETTASGGIDFSMTATFACETNDFGEAAFVHENTGSSLTLAAGATLWATRIGDSQALKAVS